MVARALLGILNILCPGSKEGRIAVESPPALDGQNLDRPLAHCLDKADKQRCALNRHPLEGAGSVGQVPHPPLDQITLPLYALLVS